MRCPTCHDEISDTAKFCKHCGADVVRERIAVAAAPQESPAPAGSQCASCGAALRPNAKFCAGCGASVTDSQPSRQPVWHPAPVAQRRPVQRPRIVSNRPPGSPIPESVSSAVKNLSVGGKIAAAGGAAAFLGCLLPMESRSGMDSAILPAIFKAMQYSSDAAIVLVLPLSAIAIVVITLCAMSGPANRRAMLGGATIAVGSPWSVVCLLALFAANRVMSPFGGYGLGAGIGIGGILLAGGFTCAVVGAFTILREAVAVSSRGNGSDKGGSQ